jgi:hypothetical protein
MIGRTTAQGARLAALLRASMARAGLKLTLHTAAMINESAEEANAREKR